MTATEPTQAPLHTTPRALLSAQNRRSTAEKADPKAATGWPRTGSPNAVSSRKPSAIPIARALPDMALLGCSQRLQGKRPPPAPGQDTLWVLTMASGNALS